MPGAQSSKRVLLAVELDLEPDRPGPGSCGRSPAPRRRRRSSDSASSSSCSAARPARQSPNGLPPSETNFSWCRRSRGNSSSLSAAMVSLHERRRAAHERVVRRERRGERPQLLLGGQPLHRLQPVHDQQPVGVLGGQLGELGGEDHRLLVAVGVEEHDPAGAVRQRGAGDRHDRRDARCRRRRAAGRRRATAGVKIPLGGSTRRVSPLAEVVADPVGGVAVAVRFTVILSGPPSCGRARQRVAARGQRRSGRSAPRRSGTGPACRRTPPAAPSGTSKTTECASAVSSTTSRTRQSHGAVSRCQ